MMWMVGETVTEANLKADMVLIVTKYIVDLTKCVSLIAVWIDAVSGCYQCNKSCVGWE